MSASVNLEFKPYESIKVIQEYKQVMVDGLQHSFPMLATDELSEAIEWSIINRIRNGPASLDNNYEKKRIDGTVLDILKYIQSLEPIITSSGVLFKQHKQSDNPLVRMVMGFLDKRAEYKNKMFEYPKGSEMYERYNLFQLLEKLNANAVYGCLGAPTSMFYNLYVAESVTRQGRSYISCSITLFEAFLANNVKFNNLDEVIMFINNVEHEKPDRKYLDSAILPKNIRREECFYKLMTTADMTIWVPTEEEMMLVWEYLRGLSQEDINRIYYKNNLYSFCDLPIITDMIIKILGKLGGDPTCIKDDKGKWHVDYNLFLNPNKPPKSVKEDLDILTEVIKEYVYYPHFYLDKLDRIEYMQRDAVAIVDTDSCFVSFDAWYRFVLSKVFNIDMPIKKEKFNMVDTFDRDEFGDLPPRNLVEIVEPEYDYNFYTDETIETSKYIEPVKLVPQENLRYAIINIIAYICSNVVVDYLAKYCELAGSKRDGIKCKLIMKNEWLMSRVMLTEHRRNYGAFQQLQEGNIVPKSKGLAIAGLPIDKSTLPDDIKKEFKEILYEDIMTCNTIDQAKIMKRLVMIENKIYNSIMNKELRYYKPDNIAAMSTYAEPMRNNGIVACIVYNEMRHDDMPEINLEERNSVIKIKLNIDKHNVNKIKDEYPQDFENLERLLAHPTLGKKLHTIALPPDVEVPDWVLPFVDYNTIISDCLKNFPLESIGLNRMNNDSVNYSNIINL